MASADRHFHFYSERSGSVLNFSKNKPANFSFGNGGTDGTVGLKDGTIAHIHWYVWPYDMRLTDEQLRRFQEIFEGVPPGNPERQERWDWPCSECDGSDIAYHATHLRENTRAAGYPFLETYRTNQHTAQRTAKGI